MLLQIQADGEVTAICTGTPIGNDTAFYENQPTPYNHSDPGIGSIFRACVAYDRWSRSRH